jgi:hypothetical protein
MLDHHEYPAASVSFSASKLMDGLVYIHLAPVFQCEHGP